MIKKNSNKGNMNFEELFISEEYPYTGKSQRDNYLSRIFGIFNEEIIRVWCRSNKSPFTDLGRPTIYDSNGKHHTLDFLLKDSKGRLFVTEMKCEISYQKYKYLTLSEPAQIERHKKKPAFQKLMDLAKSTSSHTVKCSGNVVHPYGAALVWGRVEKKETEKLKEQYSLSHIISTETVIADLLKWRNLEYQNMVSQYRSWSDELFSGLSKKL